MRSFWSLVGFVGSFLLSATAWAAEPFLEGELIFTPEHLHNHGSCIVECPNGDLITCWYNGSGERNSDDVKVEGARKRKGASAWSLRFLMADTPGFPDTNPCMFIDPQGRLWVLWQAILANKWETALAKYKISSDYQPVGLADWTSGRFHFSRGLLGRRRVQPTFSTDSSEDGAPPRWEFSDNILLKPGKEFLETVTRQTKLDEAEVAKYPVERQALVRAYLDRRLKQSADKYTVRMGWMTRAHPFVLDGKRLIVPLYSDGFNCSIMAISDDWGQTWTASAPLVGPSNIQPSIVKKKDGTLVTYMRNNGPPPKRLFVSESHDDGMTWTEVKRSQLNNPGSGAEVLGLRNGHWVMIYNDTERGRHSLAVSISDDEGATWKWTRHLEFNKPGPDATHASYPSIIQSKDGTLHASYTYSLNGKNVKKGAKGPQRECIKHVHFNEEWILEKAE